MWTLGDMFCGGGGCSVGYRRAGFTVFGVDRDERALRSYPYTCRQADAIEYLTEHGHDADVWHASPPCQADTIASAPAKARGRVYESLTARTREALIATGRPYVIEGVPGAPIRPDLELCGCRFGLGVRRRRWFECSWPVADLQPPCWHPGGQLTVTGQGSPSHWHRGRRTLRTAAEAREAMGIDWMPRKLLSQAIPPAYTEHVGRLLLAHLEQQQRTVA